jgi:alpha-L-rhamnosidase
LLFIDMAQATGNSALATQWRNDFNRLKGEFHTAFFANGRYGTGLQTEQALALWLQAPPTQQIFDAVFADLVNDIVVTQKMHTTSGIIGWKYVLEVLSRHGRTDVALGLNLQTTYPSLGFMIQGAANPEPATTIWELWDSHTEGPSMNSRNHIMFGTNGAWLYRSLGGINPAGVSGVLRISPSGINDHGLVTVTASTVVVTGPIQVSWAVPSPKTSYTLNVRIPFGQTAEVDLPVVASLGMSAGTIAVAESSKSVWARGAYVAGVDGITRATMSNELGVPAVRVVLGSGNYAFVVTSA